MPEVLSDKTEHTAQPIYVLMTGSIRFIYSTFPTNKLAEQDSLLAKYVALGAPVACSRFSTSPATHADPHAQPTPTWRQPPSRKQARVLLQPLLHLIVTPPLKWRRRRDPEPFSHTANEGQVRIHYKCLVPSYVFPENETVQPPGFQNRIIMFLHLLYISERFIIFRIVLPILLQENMWTDPGNR